MVDDNTMNKDRAQDRGTGNKVHYPRERNISLEFEFRLFH